MATNLQPKYKNPLAKYNSSREQKKSDKPGDVVVVRPPVKPRDETPQVPWREWVWSVLKSEGYPGMAAVPGMLFTGTCPYHGTTEKVYSVGLTGVCLKCYPDQRPETKGE